MTAERTGETNVCYDTQPFPGGQNSSTFTMSLNNLVMPLLEVEHG